MEMEFMAEFTEGMSRDRARQIIRGKRTKRNRTSSPFAVSTTSGNYNYSDSLINNFTSDQSPVMSSEMSTEEDEDMANCLIMLAQSVSPVKEEKSQFKFKSDQIRQKTEKLSSRRFTEMTPAIGIGNGNGKLGVYVYECKTCNRTFPSFQALGGHRASHKKPKVNVEEKKLGYSSSLTEYSDEDQQQQQQQKLVVVEDEENKSNLMIISNNVQKSPSSSSSPGFIQIINNNNNTKGKVHECAICGSEFLSGQALGGHMRKHRPTPPAAINRTGISTNTDDSTTEHHMENSNSPASMLSLDLNLPAPEMADDVQSQFQFTAGSSQSHLVFSAPALVDCHY